MTELNILIGTLAAEGRPKRMVSPWLLLASWVLLAAGTVALSLLLHGVDGDFVARAQNPLFLVETGLLLALSLTSGLAAIWLSYPDIRQQGFVRFVPFVLLGALVVFYIWQMTQAPLHPVSLAGAECVACILLFGTLPAIATFYLMRKNACTYPRIGGACALLASVSIGCFGLRLCEDGTNVSHLVVWHYGPLLLVTFMGMLAGRTFLRW